MAQPVYNGSARCGGDNGQDLATLQVRYVFRATTGTAPGAGNENIVNDIFQVEAGTAYTFSYDIRKNGSGVEANAAPDVAFIRVFKDNASLAATSGADYDSGDLITGALPVTGTKTWTPALSGTYRIALELRAGTNNTGGTSTDWTIFSDSATITRGGLATVSRDVYADMGRLRVGHRISTMPVTERGSTAPATFAVTMTGPGTATQEAIRVDVNTSASANKQSTNEVVRIRQRRNGTSTVDITDAAPSQISAADQRVQHNVSLLNYPNAAATTYDILVDILNVSALHSSNTPQYSGLGGQAGSGNWVHLVTDGTFFVDYQTAQRLSAFVVNPTGSIENIFVGNSATYAEDVNGIPTGAEATDFIATADNMTVKAGRVLNARGETMRGIFCRGEVIHETSNQSRDNWGTDLAAFSTMNNGWQQTAHPVVVATPPSGIHKCVTEGYFPSGSYATTALREFYVIRTESGSPAGVGTGKNWIAPASFLSAAIVAPPVVDGGAAVTFQVRVYNKDVLADADSVPLVTVYKGTTSFATPTVTRTALGTYQGVFTTSGLTSPTAPENYEVKAAVTYSSFTKSFSGTLETVAVNSHTGYAVDAVGLALGGIISQR